MTDIVKRLRAESRIIFDDDDFDAIDAQREEAAHEIERLRDELKWCETAKDQAMMMVDALQKKLEGK